jgi:DNA end-binding protein Ku
MRAIWTGAISFGLVTIPVKLYTATQQKDVRFRLLHRKDSAPIVEKRFCTEEDVEVDWDDLVRGFEVAKGEFVVVEPEEIEAVGPESATSIEIGDFVELTEIDPIYFEKSYYLEPREAGAKPYRLFRRALEETGRVAVARVSIRNKERLATIRVYDETLILETMYWPDEVRSVEGLELPKGEAKAAGRELGMARSLIESLSDRFKPEEYTDRYRIALQELIERKMRGEAKNLKRRKAEPKVIDLMEALEASVRAAKEGKPEPVKPEAEAEPTRKAASGRRSGTRASRSPARRTTRKEPATRKSRKAA